MKKFIFFLLGYIIGSIPTALIIGMRYYNTDVRKHGSGNLGGTNAGRVLGLKAGVIVIILDFFKCFIPMVLIKQYSFSLSLITGLGIAIGHCFPLFANFKGGKAVACSYGFLAATLFFNLKDLIILFFIPLVILLLIVKTSGYVSLATISSYFIGIVISLFFKNDYSLYYLALWILMLLRHKENIIRLINHKENKIKTGL